MKLYFRLILAALAATVALAACTKETTPPNFENDKVNPAAEGSRVIAVSFAPQTKTSLANDGLQPKFNDGDSILISNGEALDTCEVKIIGKKATISTDLTGPLTAAYPAKFAKIKDGEFDGFDIPAMQSGKFSDANLCFAEMEGKDESSLHFENCCPVLKFYVDESIGVKSIQIASDLHIAGNSMKITVEAPEGKTLYDVMPSEGQDRRICYVALDGKDVHSTDLKFGTETTTQGPVERTPANNVLLKEGHMYNAFIPYYIEVNGQKWAYCNIGAFLPEEPGYYFSWGNTQGYVYDGQNWVSAPGGQTVLGGGFTEENYAGTTGSSISGRSLKVDVTEDAACAAWGGKWRIPTSQEYQNLFNVCVGVAGYDTTTKPTTGTPSAKGVYWCDSYDGVAGCLFCDVTSKLFFPAAGEGEDTSLLGLGSGGIYWSNTLCTSNSDYAYALGFERGIYPQNKTDRYYGIPIRPICAGPAPAPEKPASLSGVFTVDSNGKKVKFTKGNLYWDGSSYQFENNQYDYRHYNGKSGDAAVINGVATTTPSGTVGSFWWISKDEVGCKPYDETYTQTLTSGEYYFFTEEPNGITGQSKANVNFAVNGESGKYHVLKENDWIYLLRLSSFGRSSDWNLFAKAKVHDVNGLLIFPDEYSLPSGYTKNEGGTGMAVINGKAEKFPENSIPDDVWSSMESDGVVFLPAAGYRTATNIQQVGNFGHYLTSFASSSGTTKLFISGTDTNKDVSCSGKASCGSGNLIRLVSEVKDN